jgi:hypothetical protein
MKVIAESEKGYQRRRDTCNDTVRRIPPHTMHIKFEGEFEILLGASLSVETRNQL